MFGMWEDYSDYLNLFLDLFIFYTGRKERAHRVIRMLDRDQEANSMHRSVGQNVQY